MKKLLFTLALTIIPFSLTAYEGTISQSGSCGATDADCHYTLYEDGHLEIIGTGQMKDYHYSTDPAPWGRDITSVEMSGIKSIGQHAFRYSTNLTEVTIPATVEEIRASAFASSRKITDIEFEENSNLKIIRTSGFNGLNSLTNITLPDSITQISSNVFNYSGIDHLVLPDSLFSVDGITEEGHIGYFHGLDLRALSNVTHIYCSEAMQQKCQQYFEEAEFYDTKDGQYHPIKEKASLAIYTSDGDKFYVNGKWYDSLSDMNKGRYNVKRIYTIEEANRVAGDKNRVSIKYK
ncbi:MAG: leucine-rich repeat domain-containing protein [Alphaproteobacteria bacterium]|nr:leucine-rich repeat domain-containing protein [Alphaproteobacteria bacterium]